MSHENQFLGVANGAAPTESDRRAAEIAGRVHEAVQKLVVTAVGSIAKTHQQGVLISALAAVATVHTLAKIIAADSHKDSHILSSTQVLTAALIAYNMAPCETGPGLTNSEFSPRAVLSAFTDFEKLTGQKPDEHLVESFATSCRQMANDPIAIAQMERARHGGRPLN
jgi:hypothetical protein